MRSCLFRCLGLFAATIVLAVLAVGVVYYFNYYKSCQLPKTYAIGDVDSRFNLSRQDLEQTAKDAEARWDDQSGKILFQYDQNSSLKINLVYDQRQANLDQLKAEIAKTNSSSDSISAFKEQLNAEITSYQADLEQYNSQVAYWNGQGGAPADVFGQLESMRTSLNSRQSAINQKAKLLNLQVDEHNTNLSDLKTEIDQEKNQIETQGEYKGDRIDIYTLDDIDGLRLVLMHELGHALSKDHATDPKSIMYYLLQDQDLSNPLPSSEDIALVKKECRIK